MDEQEISRIVVDSAFRVHKELGPGLLESVYEIVLADDLDRRGLDTARQVPISINYSGRIYRDAFRADIIVAHKVILELKCVEQLTGAHKKQLLTYLRLTNMKLGLLLNFNAELMKHGITRIANNL